MTKTDAGRAGVAPSPYPMNNTERSVYLRVTIHCSEYEYEQAQLVLALRHLTVEKLMARATAEALQPYFKRRRLRPHPWVSITNRKIKTDGQ